MIGQEELPTLFGSTSGGKKRKLFESIQESFFIEKPKDLKFVAQPKMDTGILEKIKQRETQFAKFAPKTCDRPSDADTILYLEKLGVKKFSKTSLVKRTRPRPCFHPNGQGILFTKGKTISLVKTPKVDSLPMNNILTNHVRVSGGAEEDLDA